MTTELRPQATIGASVSVKGEISGQEDILVEGGVEGLINLKQNIVTVAQTGKVKGNIYGNLIHVHGEVQGDLHGTEQVMIHKSGRVFGNVFTPRISLEDGARFKGSIDTEGAQTSAAVRPNQNKKETMIVENVGSVPTTPSDSSSKVNEKAWHKSANPQ